jgi:hemoglobin
MTVDTLESPPRTPFDLMGGVPTVRGIVDRFYDLMQQDTAYAALRDLHAPDLGPMRDSLTGFLTAWLGGPRDWFTQRPGACVMSAHAKVAITDETARQWRSAMSRALDDQGVEADLQAQIDLAFARMAAGMAARGR